MNGLGAGSGSPLSPLAVQQWAAPQPVVMEERGEIWIYYSGVNRDHAGILDPMAPTPPAEVPPEAWPASL